MYPASHFLLAIVPLTAYTLLRWRRPPSGKIVVVVLFATQLPDLVDKPLAWSFAILPSGRMLAHSLVISLPILSLLVVVAAHRGYGRSALVFSAAYLSHLGSDFSPVLRLGTEYYFFPNMFWPLLPANPDKAHSFGAYAPDSWLTILAAVGVFGVAISYGVMSVYLRRDQFQLDVPHR